MAEQFQDAFNRYLSPSPPFLNRDTVTTQQQQGLAGISNRDKKENVTDGKTGKVNDSNACHVVTDENRGVGGKGVDNEEMNLFEGVL